MTEGDLTDAIPKATVTVTLSSSWDGDGDVVVPLTVTHGTSEAGDWSVAAPNVVIRRGETSGTTSIAAWPDDDTDNETLTVALGTLPSNRLTAGTPSSVTLTINDDEGAGGQQVQGTGDVAGAATAEEPAALRRYAELVAQMRERRGQAGECLPPVY